MKISKEKPKKKISFPLPSIWARTLLSYFTRSNYFCAQPVDYTYEKWEICASVYAGVDGMILASLYSMCFPSKTPNEAQDLLEQLTYNSYQFEKSCSDIRVAYY